MNPLDHLCAEVSGFLQGYAFAKGGWASPGKVYVRKRKFCIERWIFADFDIAYPDIIALVAEFFDDKLKKLLANEKKVKR